MSPRSGRAGARAGARRRPRLAARGQRRAATAGRAAGPHSSHAPEATSASSASRPAGARRARSPTSAIRLPGGDRLRLVLADRADVAEPDPHRAVLDRAAAPRCGSRAAGAPRSRAAGRRGRATPAGRSPSAARSGARRGTRPGSSGAATPTGRRAARTPRRATSGSRTRRSRRACRRSREPFARRSRSPMQPSTKRGRNASIASSLRLRLIARRSPSASPTLNPAAAIADVEHLVLEDDDAERVAQRLAQRLVLDRVGRSSDPRAAAAGARCTDGRPCPGSGPGGRARPARSGRRGSPAACAAGSASARGSRSGRGRPCRRPGSRRRPSGSSSGMRERSIGSPCRRAIWSTASSTAESIPSPSRSIFRKPASAHESLSHWQICRPAIAAGCTGTRSIERPRRDHHPARVLGDVARQAGDLARQLAERLPARAGVLSAPGRPAIPSSSSPTRVASQPSVTRASRSSSPNGSPSALPTSRIAPRLR